MVLKLIPGDQVFGPDGRSAVFVALDRELHPERYTRRRRKGEQA